MEELRVLQAVRLDSNTDRKASAAKTKAVCDANPSRSALRNLNSRVDMQAN